MQLVSCVHPRFLRDIINFVKVCVYTYVYIDINILYICIIKTP